MMQRIIDWFNGYTLNDKLELECILTTAKKLAIDKLSNTHKIIEYKKKAIGEINSRTRAVVVNTNVSFYKAPKDDIMRQLILLNEEGSSVRVRITLVDEIGNELDFCEEYSLCYIKKNKCQ